MSKKKQKENTNAHRVLLPCFHCERFLYNSNRWIFIITKIVISSITVHCQTQRKDEKFMKLYPYQKYRGSIISLLFYLFKPSALTADNVESVPLLELMVASTASMIHIAQVQHETKIHAIIDFWITCLLLHRNFHRRTYR